MKVVIFCGGLGVRMGEATQRDPQADDPDRQPADPLAHHEVLRATAGITDFILCLGYQGRGDQGVLPQLQRGAVQRLRALGRRRATSSCSRATSPTGASRSSTPGCKATIGERLQAVARITSSDDDDFLATYGDGLTDAPLADDDRARSATSGKIGELPLGAPAVQLPRRRRRTPTASSRRSRT